LWEEFDAIQNRIEDIQDSEAQIIERSHFEDNYFKLIATARELQVSERALPNQIPQQAGQFLPQAEDNSGQALLRPSVKLPNIELPKFDGNYEHWIPFRDLFESFIASNITIPAVQKLHYLRTALTSEAAKVIASLDITNSNYEVAWNSLKQRYENKKLIVQHLIHALANLPYIAKESHIELRQLADNVSQNIQSLAKLGQPVEHWGTLLIYHILPKIDKGSRREWNLQTSTAEEFPTLEEFIKFLIKRSAFLEANRDMQITAEARGKASQAQNKIMSRSYVASNSSVCPICSESHRVYECKLFLNMSIADRNMEIKKKRLCVKCLKEYHGKNCKASNCKSCKGFHNTLLHKSKPQVGDTNNSESKPSHSDSTSSNSIKNHDTRQITAAFTANPSLIDLNHCTIKGSSQVLLSTASLLIHDLHGETYKCRALLDSGSQSNFITRQLCDKLKLKHKTINETIMGINDTPISAVQQVNAIIQSRTSAYQAKLPFLIIDRITGRLPTFQIDTNSIHIPHYLKLADPNYYIPGDIDLLLGASTFWELLRHQRIQSSKGSPVLQETALGWIIAGNIQANCEYQKKEYCGISTKITIQNQLEKFWHMEEIKQSKDRSLEETQCEEHFITTHSRNQEGRFLVQLPLKEGILELGEFRDIAEKRFKSLERKLERQPKLKQQYHEFMREYAQLNHMTKVPINETHATLAYYIPHHAVIKEDSETTKLRVVFDASCKTTSGHSLNDFLKTGPNLQEDLFDIIMRMRQYKYALAADITKMYRQI